MPAPYARIHHFSSQCCDVDAEGEPLLGYYYEIIGADGLPLHSMMGPYASKDEVEAACDREWRDGDA